MNFITSNSIIKIHSQYGKSLEEESSTGFNNSFFQVLFQFSSIKYNKIIEDYIIGPDSLVRKRFIQIIHSCLYFV